MLVPDPFSIWAQELTLAAAVLDSARLQPAKAVLGLPCTGWPVPVVIGHPWKVLASSMGLIISNHHRMNLFSWTNACWISLVSWLIIYELELMSGVVYCKWPHYRRLCWLCKICMDCTFDVNARWKYCKGDHFRGFIQWFGKYLFLSRAHFCKQCFPVFTG